MINQEVSVDDSGRCAQTIEAAFQVMAEHGFGGASIKRIAERAGLKSPALIYWYFKDKHALLEAIFQRMSPFLSTVAHADAKLDDPPEQVLPLIANSFVTVVSQPQTGSFMRIVLSEFARHPAVADFFAERGPLVVLKFLYRYLTRQIELGRLRPHDPRAAARAFMGMLVVYVLGREVFVAIGSGFPRAELYAQEVTAIFLHGLSAQSSDVSAD